MGLKTKNYELKSLGVTVPEAYAKIKDIHINDDIVNVTFYIQKDRESINSLSPLSKVNIQFKLLNKNLNVFEEAYKYSKLEIINGKVKNPETDELEDVKYKLPFYGWEDDIVNENDLL